MDPRPHAPDQRTAQLVDDFLAAQLRPRTRATYATDLATYLRWLAQRGTHPLNAHRRDVDRYRNWMTELVDPAGNPARLGQPRYASATVAKRLSAVRSFYAYLVSQNMLDASPAVAVKAPRTTREPRGRAITEDQLAALIKAAREHSHAAEAIVRLLATNGLRVSEVCAARVEQLDREPDGGICLILEGKGGRRARIPLNNRTSHVITTVTAGRKSGLLFERRDRRRTRHGHHAPSIPYTQQAVWRLLERLAASASLVDAGGAREDHVHPHRLRHTFVTLLLDRGHHLPTVQDAARHASADTTRLYDRQRDAYQSHPTHELVF